MPQPKRIFNFYLDDYIKDQANEKLERLLGGKNKGQLSSLIRVLLKEFILTPDEKISPLLKQAIDVEYEYSAKLNKRSRN